LLTLAGVVLGALTSFLVSSLGERSRHRRELRKGWTEKRLDAYAQYLSDIKRMREVARRIAAGAGLDERPSPLSKDEGLPMLADAEGRRDVSFEMVTLLGSEATVRAGRKLNQAVWKIEWYARGKLPTDDRDGWDQSRREFTAAQREFHECVRRELAIPGASVPRSLSRQPRPDERPG
jgi:hypothetical protein